MLHQIKALYDEGNGLSQRAIAKELKVSRTTVRKYLTMSVEEINAYKQNQQRPKLLDEHRD